MTHTAKKTMSLHVESAMDRNGHLTEIALVAQDDLANEWLDYNIGDGTEDSRRSYYRKSWTLGPGHGLEKILGLFMSEGGVIG